MSDTDGNQILKYASVNGVVSSTPTVVATGLNKPSCITFDNEGNLFEIESATDNINKFPCSNGVLSTAPVTFIDASPEHADMIGPREPSYLIFDRQGNLYVAISVGGILKFSHTRSGLSNLPDDFPFSTVSRVRERVTSAPATLRRNGLKSQSVRT